MTIARMRLATLSLTTAAIAAICGCGGSKGLGRSELIAKADPICRRANQTLVSSKLSIQNVAQVSPAIAAAQHQASIELAKLTPPSAMAGDWKTIVDNWRIAGESILKFGEATKAKSLQAQLAAERRFTFAQVIRSKTAGQHGFHDCSSYG